MLVDAGGRQLHQLCHQRLQAGGGHHCWIKQFSTQSGTTLKVLDCDDLKQGAVVELTNATDLEIGPDEPSPVDTCVFIVTCQSEH